MTFIARFFGAASTTGSATESNGSAETVFALAVFLTAAFFLTSFVSIKQKTANKEYAAFELEWQDATQGFGFE
jgi:hypothetical protein